MKQIVFVGLDHMGAPMATNLFKADYLLNVFSLVQNTVGNLVTTDASAVRGARDAVQGADVVIGMLSASQHVEGLYLDDDGLLTHIAPGTLVPERSTIAPTSACKVRVTTHERSLAMLDALMPGGAASAAAGTLAFMIGGNAEAPEKARPLFRVMGRDAFRASPDNTGQVAKVHNNQLPVMLIIGTTGATVLGTANGLEVKVPARIMRHSSSSNWTLEVYNPWPGVMENVPAPYDHGSGFMAQLMIRDLGLAQEVAQASTSGTLMDSLALSLYRLLLKQNYAERDFSVVQKSFDPAQDQQAGRRVHTQTGQLDDMKNPP